MIIELKCIKISTVLLLLSLSSYVSGQVIDTLKTPLRLSASVTVTNNGISFIPSFTLGKPAAIFDFVAGKRLSFEPQFRFSLEGKPWSFIFWFRYKAVNNNKFKLTIGAHPALSFKILDATIDTIQSKEIVAHRFLAGELNPNFFFSRNVSAGIYIFDGYALERDQIRNSFMLALRSNFNNIRLTENFSMRIAPQFYYLRMADMDGYYFSATASLFKKNLPVSLSALINKPIRSDVKGGQKFIWNLSLIYAFNGEYLKK